MNRTRNRARRQKLQYVNFDLTSELTPLLTYTRNDTAATYRNSSGQLVQATANQPRFDHDISGNALGLRFEPSRTNKCTGYNLATATTNITVAGTGAALTIVNDTSALTSYGVNTITGGMAFNLTAGSGTATATVGGTTGNTNTHRLSVVARVVSGSGDLRLSGTSSTTSFSGSSYARYELQQIPSSSSASLRITATAGSTVRFVLFQLEQATDATSFIVTAGANATRAADRLTGPISNYVLSGSGYIGVKYIPEVVSTTSQYPVVINDGTTNNTFGLRLGDGSTSYAKGYVRGGGATKHQSSTFNTPQVNKVNSGIVAWGDGFAWVSNNGVGAYEEFTGNPSGITTIDIGARNGGSDPFRGWISDVALGRVYNIGLAGAKTVGNSNRFIGSGQSLMENLFTSVEDTTPAGAQAFIDIADNTLTNVVYFAAGATGGAYASKQDSSDVNETNYFYDADTGFFDGDAAKKFIRAAQSIAGVRAIFWDQGQASAIGLNAGNITRAEYKATITLIFAWMRSLVGNVPIIIQPIGRRSDSAAYGQSWQDIREVEQELASELSNVYLGPEIYDLTLFDAVHPNKASEVIMGQRSARKGLSVLGESVSSVDGPEIASAIRSGTTVTVTLTHADGTDFTPTTGIEGFYFTDDDVQISITAAVRTNATTITLTLNSTPTGVEVLYYAYGIMDGITASNIVKDNSANALPLRAAKITL